MKKAFSKTTLSFVYLWIGILFLFFFNGRWILPLAAFIAPVFLIRFLRLQKPFIGFLIIVITGWVVNVFVWKGMLPMAGVIYYIVCFMMSVFSSLTYFLDRIYTRKIKGFISTLAFPSAYVILDYITVLTNPSGSYGTLVHTQSSLPLLQLVSVTGIWGVSFLIMWTASVINWLWDASFEKAKVRLAFMVYAFPFLLILLWGQFRLSQAIDAPTVRVAAINSTKEAYQHRISTTYDSLVAIENDAFLSRCETAASSGAKIVFGRETLIALPADMEADFMEKAKTIASRSGIYIGVPIQIIPKENANKNPENKISWISPEGVLLFAYHKARPTYPGECDYGDGVIHFFDSPYGRIGSAICFDMDFPLLIRQAGQHKLDILLVPGSDWEEITPYHTYVASVRGIENGFNLVRSTFKGFSAAFNYKGQVLSSNDFFETDEVIFYSDVPVKGSPSIYALLDDYFAWFSIAVFVFLSISLLKGRA